MEIIKKPIEYVRFFLLLKRYKLYKSNKIKTHVTYLEKLKLYDLVYDKGGICVEIGSYLGASSSFIACALKASDRQGHLYCIDTWDNNAMSEGLRDTYGQFIENTSEFSDHITTLRGLSYDIASSFKKKIDFLFIDGDHSYEGVKADVEQWLPKLNQGATIVFHDISWAKGVQKIISERISSIARIHEQLPNLYWATL